MPRAVDPHAGAPAMAGRSLLADMDQGHRRRELQRNRDREADLEIVDWFGQLVAQRVDIPAALAPIAALHGVQVRTPTGGWPGLGSARR